MDPTYNGDRKENCQIIDSKDRTCQKINYSKDRKDSNIRKDSKNRNGHVMRSHDRSPVIVVCNSRAVHRHRIYSFMVPIYTVPYTVPSGALEIILQYGLRYSELPFSTVD